MSFQSTVTTPQGFGVIGELFTDSPVRSAPAVLDTGADNYIGRAYTSNGEGTVEQGGTGAFAGILASPKSYASYGTAGNTLAPTLVLEDGVVGELVTMGEIIVKLTGTASIGDTIQYNTTTGELSAIANGATLTAGNLNAFGVVSRYNVGANDLAVIMLTSINKISAP